MKFGVISTANIAEIAVVPGIQKTENEVVAVGSRDKSKAENFGDKFGIEKRYGSYQEVVEDEEVDAVYNPLPNSMHAEWTKKAADSNLDVLCEKPLGIDTDDARAMWEYCDDKGVTLMEAFMYRYHPRTERAKEIVENELDEIRSVKSAFHFPLRGHPENIRLQPELGGGSLMDVGCYAVNASRLFLGEPQKVHGVTHDTRDTGVDTNMAAVLEYEDATAEVSSGFDTGRTEYYRVEATNGWLKAENTFVPPDDEKTKLEYEVDGRKVVEEFDPVDQYKLEVEHFVECVEEGKNPRTDAEEATKTLQVIDGIYESAERGESVEL